MDTSPPTGRPSALEIGAVALALALIVLAQVWLTGSGAVFTRHFWLDEIYTHTLVTDHDLAHSLRALAAGVETHPPALYLLLRLFTRISGGADEVRFHIFGFGCMLVALTGLYAALRRVFSPGVSLAATLWFAGHPAVVLQSFDARFYALWLAGIAWFAYFLSDLRVSPGNVWMRLGVAGCSVLVCTVHYLGIVTLVLVSLAEVLARRRERLSVGRTALAVALGPLACLACLPLLASQRAATTVPTWVAPPDGQRVTSFLVELAAPRTFLVPAVAAWLGALFRSTGNRPAGLANVAPHASALAGLTGLLLMPVVLVTLSFAFQSMLVARYGIATVLGLSVPVAYLMSGLPRSGILAAAAIFAVSGALEIRQQASAWSAESGAADRLIAAIRSETDQALVAFESPAQLYVVCHYAPDLANRCMLIDFEPGEIPNDPPSRIFNRDLARQYSRFYGTPRNVPWAQLKTVIHFYLVPIYITGGEVGGAWQEIYPGFVVRRRSRELYDALRLNPATTQ